MALLNELAAAGTPRYSTAEGANPAGENSALVVGHQAILYGGDGRNTDTTNAIYIMFFDAATVAAVLAGAKPIICIGVPPAGSGATIANGNWGYSSGSSFGERFKLGIVVAASSTDANVGYTAIATNKTTFHVQYASEDGLSSS
jgi:hypothetical protein